MSDEGKLQNAVYRASRAKELMADELLTEAFKKLDAEYVEAWRETHVRDDDSRQRLWQAVQVLGKVQAHLAKVLSDGRLAKRELDSLAGKRRLFG